MASYAPILDNDELETKSLQQKQQIKSSKKSNYGSLRVDPPQQTKQTSTAFIVNYKHKISSGETLLGVSLKYGVPVDQIKRANRLWSNDLAFVKESLIIPIDREKLKEIDSNYQDDSDDLSQVNIDLNTKNSKANNGQENEENDNTEFKDYLNKYDTFITESKLKLKSLKTMSNIANSEFLNNTNGKTSKSNQSYDEGDDDLFKLNSSNKNGRQSSTEYLIIDPSEIRYDTDHMLNGSSHSKKNNTSFSFKSSSTNNLQPQPRSSSPDGLSANGKASNMNKSTSSASSVVSTSSSNRNNNSRARLVAENLQRLEREKDDLYEL